MTTRISICSILAHWTDHWKIEKQKLLIFNRYTICLITEKIKAYWINTVLFIKKDQESMRACNSSFFFYQNMTSRFALIFIRLIDLHFSFSACIPQTFCIDVLCNVLASIQWNISQGQLIGYFYLEPQENGDN